MSKGKSGIHGKAYDIVGQYSLSSLTDSRAKIVDFYRSVDEGGGIRIDEGRIKVSKEAMREANELADTLSRRMVVHDFAAEQMFKEIRAELRDTYTISAKDSANIPDFKRYLRSPDNFLRIGKSGLSINTKYEELSSRYPDYFSRSVTNPAEQLQIINSTLSDLRNSTISLPRSQQEEYRSELRNDIIRGYLTARRRRNRTA